MAQGYTSQLPLPLTVINGGTGVVSNTSYSVLCGGTSGTGAIQSVASVGSAGQVLTSNGAGALPTFQGYCGFSVNTSAYINDVTGDGTVYTIPFNTVIIDSNSGYNTGTGIYTIPKTGIYHFSSLVLINDLTASHTNMDLNLVFSTGKYFVGGVCSPANVRNSTTALCATVFGIISLSANDTVKVTITVYNGTKVVNVGGGANQTPILSGFSGHLIGV